MFCPITEDWRGRPLVSRSVVVDLIGNTRTEAGLRINAELDTDGDPTGVKVTDEELATVRIQKAKFHGEGNSTISPRSEIHQLILERLLRPCGQILGQLRRLGYRNRTMIDAT